jgi:hypothetical protein
MGQCHADSLWRAPGYKLLRQQNGRARASEETCTTHQERTAAARNRPQWRRRYQPELKGERAINLIHERIGQWPGLPAQLRRSELLDSHSSDEPSQSNQPSGGGYPGDDGGQKWTAQARFRCIRLLVCRLHSIEVRALISPRCAESCGRRCRYWPCRQDRQSHRPRHDECHEQFQIHSPPHPRTNGGRNRDNRSIDQPDWRNENGRLPSGPRQAGQHEFSNPEECRERIAHASPRRLLSRCSKSRTSRLSSASSPGSSEDCFPR